MKEYLWPLISLGLALSVSGLPLVIWLDPHQRSSNDFDNWGIWLIAILAWILPATMMRMVQRERSAYIEQSPVLVVSDTGLQIITLNGRKVLPWSELAWDEVQEKNGERCLYVYSGKISGMVSLEDLDSEPDKILAAISKFQSPES